mgnify:CR=1 FL=1
MTRLKKYYPNHAVIASLMVDTRQEWETIIKEVQDAGADGIMIHSRQEDGKEILE